MMCGSSDDFKQWQ